MLADSLGTHACPSLDLGAESIGVPLKNGLHGRLAGAFILHVVAAVDTVASIAVAARRKTFTVPAETMLGDNVCMIGQSS